MKRVKLITDPETKKKIVERKYNSNRSEAMPDIEEREVEGALLMPVESFLLNNDRPNDLITPRGNHTAISHYQES